LEPRNSFGRLLADPDEAERQLLQRLGARYGAEGQGNESGWVNTTGKTPEKSTISRGFKEAGRCHGRYHVYLSAKARMFILLISAFFFCGLLWDILELDTYHIALISFFPLGHVPRYCGQCFVQVLWKNPCILDMLQTTKNPIVHGMGSAFVRSTQIHKQI